VAINATAVWRIRVGGNDANGAGYDSAISGAGTDYSQQDAAQLSLTDVACSGTTTVTSVTGGFTAAMIGNAIRITGGGATSGYYFITARTNTNTITVDRTPGTVSGGTGKVGGAAAMWRTLLDDLKATGDKVVPGNKVYIRGSGTNTPSSDDYTDTTYTQMVPGDGTSGKIQLLGENGRPRLKSTGLIFYQPNYVVLRNLYLTCSSNSNGTLGLINAGGRTLIDDCVLDTNNLASMQAVVMNGGSTLVNCKVFATTGTPSSSTDSPLIRVGTYGCRVIGNRIFNGRAEGIVEADGGSLAQLVGNLVYGCFGKGIQLGDLSTLSQSGIVTGNTVYGNGGDGIYFKTFEALLYAVYNNSITNNGGYGINVATGALALADSFRQLVDYNNVYGNTSGSYSSNLSAGTHDLSVDPGYVDAAAGNFTPTNVALRAAFPTSFP
jgi:hypothetical protein